jgi:hypothetical protein
MENKSEVTKSGRGVFLWVMLAGYMFISFQRLLSLLVPSAFPQIYAGAQPWGYGANIVIFVLEIAGLVGIIRWKKWGLYLMVVLQLTEVVLSLIYSISRTPIELRLAVDLGLLALLVWAASRKWQNFKNNREINSR